MTMKTVSPYGTWESPITAKLIASETRDFDCPRVNPESGRAFFGETTPDGRKTIVEVTKSGVKEVLPADFSAENSVYGYGAAIFGVLHDDRIIFSNRDKAVCLLDPDSGNVTELFESSVLHYASFDPNPSLSWVLAVEEDRTQNTADGTKNHVVAINVDTNEVKRVLTGADFYFQPRFDATGSRVSWLQYNRPELPYTDAQLYVADWSPDGTITNRRFIVGSEHESVAEPRWGPDGTLYFAQEAGPYRQLFRVAPGSNYPVPIELAGLEEAEFSFAGHVEPINTYAILDKDHILATALINGVTHVVCIDVTTNEWKELSSIDSICHLPHDAVWRFDSTSAIIIGAGAASASAVHLIDVIDSQRSAVLRGSLDQDLPAGIVSRAEPVHICSTGSPPRNIHGFLWQPHNPEYTAPDDTLPPVIIETHGGPVSQAGCELNLLVQYFTSRGFAYLQVNYAGSTGYGREYRQSLFGHWGVVDTEDVVELADHLITSKQVNPGTIGITGASAGGYNTLQVLSKYSDKFAGGVCLCGISDLETLQAGTHKIEADSTSALVVKNPTTISEEGRLKVFHDRSAIYHSETIRSPLLLIHGQEDTAVPIGQARTIHETLKRRGADVKLIEVPGDGHMLSKPDTVQMTLEETERWWRRTLVKAESC